MRMSLQKAAKLAYLTRRYDRRENPIAYKLSRWWLRQRCHKKKHKPAGRLVMPHDAGLVNVDLGTKMGYDIMFDGYRDPELARMIRHASRPGNVCIDIGAHIGSYTLVMAFAVGQSGRVIAVEPHPQILERLLANIALNHLDNVSVMNAAMAQEDGETTLYTYAADATNQLIASLEPSRQSRESIQVRAISGPTLLEELNITRCDLIKTDAGGADVMVLKGLSSLISSQRPWLLVGFHREWWEKFHSRLEDAVELLRPWGYDFYLVSRDITAPLGGAIPDRCDLLCVPSCERGEVPDLVRRDS